MTPAARLSRAAWLALGAHLAAGAAMLLILRRGLESNPDLADRLAFLGQRRVLWACGWLTWTAAGGSILYFYRCYAEAHDGLLGRAGKAATAVALLAVACDWTAQGVEVLVLPGLARRGETASFLLLHRKAVLLTGGAANTLYTAAAALLLWPTRGSFPPWTTRAGWGVVLFGALLTLAAAAGSAPGMVLANAGLVPCLAVWLAGVALAAARS